MPDCGSGVVVCSYIRDKIAASKKKGMWMGGPVLLGYDVKERKLVVNAGDAATVRHIFTRYAALGSGQKLIAELREAGYRTKVRQRRSGSIIGGIPFGRGMVFAMLSNRIYHGEIVHKDVAHPGEHEAIIDQQLWDAVQGQIAANRIERRTRTNAAHASLLAGIIRDPLGRAMSPSHAVSNGKRYRYYITRSSELEIDDRPAARLPAYDIEKIVAERIGALLKDRQMIHGAVSPVASDASGIAAALAQAATAAKQLETHYGKRSIVTALASGVHVKDDQLVILIDRAALLRLLGILVEQQLEPVELIAPAVKVRRGKETKLIIAGTGGAMGETDKRLIALLREARSTLEQVLARPECSLAELARERTQCRKRMARLVRVAWLAPDIVRIILKDKQPASLTAATLMQLELPADWDHQRRVLGIG